MKQDELYCQAKEKDANHNPICKGSNRLCYTTVVVGEPKRWGEVMEKLTDKELEKKISKRAEAKNGRKKNKRYDRKNK